jgi:hypothetical protein
MEVTKEQAGQMYARACRAWYGPRAKAVVKNKIKHLEKKGDFNGVHAWTEVARQLAQMPASDFERERRS